jgi:uncharacterized protein involved in outer membrane biogenesis
MARRTLKWVIAIGIGVSVTLLAVSFFVLRPGYLKGKLTEGLARHLQLDVEIGEISVSLLPRPQVVGRGLVLKVPARPDLPPFISIDRFT